MTAPAAFKGNYANLVTRKTRGVCVIEIEIAIEQMQAFVAAFGAPLPGVEIPVAIARLQPDKPSSEPRKGNGEAVPKERRPFGSLPLSQQAAMRCGDEGFRRFLAERDKIWGPPYTPEAAATRVRDICGVSSRSFIVEGDKTGDRWLALDGAYQDWKHAVPLAEPIR